MLPGSETFKKLLKVAHVYIYCTQGEEFCLNKVRELLIASME